MSLLNISTEEKFLYKNLALLSFIFQSYTSQLFKSYLEAKQLEIFKSVLNLPLLICMTYWLGYEFQVVVHPVLK